MKVIIVGGVAGGASCAARLRRLDESAEILVVERGPYISYANCGLPYYVGGLIPRESKLVLADAALFRAQLNVEVRTLCEAVSIEPEARTIQLRNVATGEVTTESYDKLVLSPGASPIWPALPGIDLPGIFKVRTVPDVHVIREWMEGHVTDPSGLDTYTGSQTVLPARRAVVVGGGFIGLEMAENLVHLGLDVTLVQRGPQLMSPMDAEMARYVERHVGRNGVKLALGEDVTGFRQAAGTSLEVLTESGKAIPADIVVMGIGVRPEVGLAKTAGLAIGERGGILVDDHMRTSVPDIFAVGDAIEVRDHVTGELSHVPLAGPANRQGRIAAEVIAGRDSRFRGTQGTAIVGVFGGAAGWTGVSEKTLRRVGDTDYEKVYLYPNSHAGYYPGAQYLAMKILFRKSDGRLLGAQAVGLDGVDKRIDAFAMALQFGATVYDLEEAELTLRAAVRQREVTGQLRRDGRRRRPPRRHAGGPLGRRAPVPPRRPPAGGAGRRAGAGRGQHPAPRAAGPPRRAAARPGDPRHLPVRPAGLLRDAGPPAERVRGPQSSPGGCCRTRRSRPGELPGRGEGDPGVSRAWPGPDTAVACTTEQAVLGEGARWDARRGELLRVDIAAGRVYRDRVDRDGGLIPVRVYAVPGTVGAIAPIEGDAGWLLAAGRGFVHLAPDGALHSIVEVAPAMTRMNDAACDPQGRFWAGTLADDHHVGGGALYRLERDGQVELVLDGLTISNGLAWSPDGRTMYLADSGPGVIHAFAFDGTDGTLSLGRELVVIPAADGVPDGLTVDASGDLWVAVFGGSCVRRYTPDGRLRDVLDVPAEQVTSCAFGGPRMRRPLRHDGHRRLGRRPASGRPGGRPRLPVRHGCHRPIGRVVPAGPRLVGQRAQHGLARSRLANGAHPRKTSVRPCRK